MKTGDFTRSNPSQSFPRRPLSEGYPDQVFWLSHPLSSLPVSSLSRDSGYPFAERVPFLEKGGITAAGPSPTLPTDAGITGFPLSGYHRSDFKTYLTNLNFSVKFFIGELQKSFLRSLDYTDFKEDDFGKKMSFPWKRESRRFL